jgi:DnaJ-class molecular chaperone
MKEAANTKPTESKCPACRGTGYPAVMQPMRPGRKIFAAPCKKCGGKGRIAEAATEAASFEKPRWPDQSRIKPILF